jgi:hypothetical protein
MEAQGGRMRAHLSSLHKCTQCELNFLSKEGMEKHSARVHEGKAEEFTRFKCEKCKLDFKTKAEFQQHKVAAKATGSCSVCQKTGQNPSFVNICEYTAHRNEHSRRSDPKAKTKIDCTDCGSEFPSYGAVTRHRAQRGRAQCGRPRCSAVLAGECDRAKHWREHSATRSIRPGAAAVGKVGTQSKDAQKTMEEHQVKIQKSVLNGGRFSTKLVGKNIEIILPGEGKRKKEHGEKEEDIKSESIKPDSPLKAPAKKKIKLVKGNINKQVLPTKETNHESVNNSKFKMVQDEKKEGAQKKRNMPCKLCDFKGWHLGHLKHHMKSKHNGRTFIDNGKIQEAREVKKKGKPKGFKENNSALNVKLQAEEVKKEEDPQGSNENSTAEGIKHDVKPVAKEVKKEEKHKVSKENNAENVINHDVKSEGDTLKLNLNKIQEEDKLKVGQEKKVTTNLKEALTIPEAEAGPVEAAGVMFHYPTMTAAQLVAAGLLQEARPPPPLPALRPSAPAPPRPLPGCHSNDVMLGF